MASHFPNCSNAVSLEGKSNDDTAASSAFARVQNHSVMKMPYRSPRIFTSQFNHPITTVREGLLGKANLIGKASVKFDAISELTSLARSQSSRPQTTPHPIFQNECGFQPRESDASSNILSELDKHDTQLNLELLSRLGVGTGLVNFLNTGFQMGVKHDQYSSTRHDSNDSQSSFSWPTNESSLPLIPSRSQVDTTAHVYNRFMPSSNSAHVESSVGGLSEMQRMQLLSGRVLQYGVQLSQNKLRWKPEHSIHSANGIVLSEPFRNPPLVLKELIRNRIHLLDDHTWSLASCTKKRKDKVNNRSITIIKNNDKNNGHNDSINDSNSSGGGGGGDYDTDDDKSSDDNNTRRRKRRRRSLSKCSSTKEDECDVQSRQIMPSSKDMLLQPILERIDVTHQLEALGYSSSSSSSSCQPGQSTAPPASISTCLKYQALENALARHVESLVDSSLEMVFQHFEGLEDVLLQTTKQPPPPTAVDNEEARDCRSTASVSLDHCSSSSSSSSSSRNSSSSNKNNNNSIHSNHSISSSKYTWEHVMQLLQSHRDEHIRATRATCTSSTKQKVENSAMRTPTSSNPILTAVGTGKVIPPILHVHEDLPGLRISPTVVARTQQRLLALLHQSSPTDHANSTSLETSIPGLAHTSTRPSDVYPYIEQQQHPISAHSINAVPPPTSSNMALVEGGGCLRRTIPTVLPQPQERKGAYFPPSVPGRAPSLQKQKLDHRGTKDIQHAGSSNKFYPSRELRHRWD